VGHGGGNLVIHISLVFGCYNSLYYTGPPGCQCITAVVGEEQHTSLVTETLIKVDASSSLNLVTTTVTVMRGCVAASTMSPLTVTVVPPLHHHDTCRSLLEACRLILNISESRIVEFRLTVPLCVINLTKVVVIGVFK